MHMTRRTFLEYATGAMATSLGGLRFDLWQPTVLLDLKQHSGLSESVAGYEATHSTFRDPRAKRS